MTLKVQQVHVFEVPSSFIVRLEQQFSGSRQVGNIPTSDSSQILWFLD